MYTEDVAHVSHRLVPPQSSRFLRGGFFFVVFTFPVHKDGAELLPGELGLGCWAGVDDQAPDGQVLLLLVEERGRAGEVGQVEPDDDGQEDRGQALEKEDPLPPYWPNSNTHKQSIMRTSFPWTDRRNTCMQTYRGVPGYRPSAQFRRPARRQRRPPWSQC